MNKDLRTKIVETVYNAGEGHIPSSFSIVDILSTLYGKFLKYDSKNPDWEERDYFILSKGHGAVALYVVLEKYGFITQDDLMKKSSLEGRLGGHPDCTKVPGVEASTGSLGHGLVTAMGIALGLKIRNKKNKVITLIGDGESNEGTVWETALVAPNLKLGNYCIIIDNNKSAEQILPVPNMKQKWESFGWDVYETDGHSEKELLSTLNKISFDYPSPPKVIIANTIKGKGVSFIEGHGSWHHKIPNEEELYKIKEELISNHG
jgi:transketolase